MNIYKNNSNSRNVCLKKLFGGLSEAKRTAFAARLPLTPLKYFIGHTFLNHFKFVMLIILWVIASGALLAQDAGTPGVVAQGAVANAAGTQREPVRLTPNEAVDMAIRSNLSLESARVSTSTKKRTMDLWWNQFIPNVTVAGSLIRDNERSTVSGVAPVDLSTIIPSLPSDTLYGVYPYSVKAPQWHVAGTIQASLVISYAVFEYVKQLRLDYQSGLIAYEKAKLQLERDIRKAYNNMTLLQASINLLRESYEAAGRRVEMARANYRAGLVPELSLLQAQVAMENMKPTIDQVENGYRLSMAQFAMFLGLPYDTPFELAPVETDIDFVPLDVKELLSKAATGKPDIQELRHSILMLQSARKLQLHSFTPALTFSWSSQSLLVDPWKDNWFDYNSWRRSGQFTISLGMRLHSFIPWSTDSQGIKNIDDSIRKANIGLAQLIQGTEIEIYNTILSLERIRITTEAQTQTVNLAERAYGLSERAYRAGLQDLLQVQNAELELKQAKLSMLEQQFNYFNGLIDLEYSIGVPFGTLTSKENR
jgi:outer membrane protein TolC